MEGKGSGHSTQVKRVTRCTWRFMEGGAEPPREESLPLNGRVRRIVCKKPLCARLLAVSACGSRSPPASHSSTWPLTSSGASACGSSVLSGIAALTFTACLRLHACPSVTSHLTGLPPSLSPLSPQSARVSPTPASYAIAISAYGRAGQTDNASCVFHSIKDRRVSSRVPHCNVRVPAGSHRGIGANCLAPGRPRDRGPYRSSHEMVASASTALTSQVNGRAWDRFTRLNMSPCCRHAAIVTLALCALPSPCSSWMPACRQPWSQRCREEGW